jgi:hypothetical protein
MLERPQEYFTTPGGANLAGVGLFSPPQSRTPSPPITRRSTKESLTTRHVPTPVSLGTVLDTYSEAKEAAVKATLTPEEAPTEAGPVASPVNGGHSHPRNDSSNDGDATPSQITLRRRKAAMDTPNT